MVAQQRHAASVSELSWAGTNAVKALLINMQLATFRVNKNNKSNSSQ